MLSEKNLEELSLTEEQMKKYREFVQKEKLLRMTLKECGVHAAAIEGIIARSDLNKVNADNVEALKEDIKNSWSDFIIHKSDIG